MFTYDTLVINELYDQLDDLEDELVYAAGMEEAMMRDQQGSLQAPALSPTMEDLQNDGK